MNYIKKTLGIFWILSGPLCIYVLVNIALHEIEKKPVIDTKIQWAVFIFVFIPIALGFMLFGYYALKGEYDSLPENSSDLN